jgi:hypothetical protein
MGLRVTSSNLKATASCANAGANKTKLKDAKIFFIFKPLYIN